jgi:hypothetical protein
LNPPLVPASNFYEAGYAREQGSPGWAPFEAAIVGQNLLDQRHPEFAPTTISTLSVEVERSFYGKLTWHF